jgi:hypothetical protein
MTMLPHVKRAGRLGQHPALIRAAARMGKTDADKEVNRVLEGAQFAEVPDMDSEISLNDLDLDLESDAGENLAAAEGGTGGCSDSGSAGVGEDEEQEDRGEVERSQPSQSSDASSSTAGVTSRSSLDASVLSRGPSSPSASKPSGIDPLAPTEQDTDSGKPRAVQVQSPTSVGAAEVALHTPPVSPNSLKCNTHSPKSPSSAPAFDPVEDSLVDQGEVEREMDDTFAERRFLAEAKADVATGASILSGADAACADTTDLERPGEDSMHAPAAGLGIVKTATGTTAAKVAEKSASPASAPPAPPVPTAPASPDEAMDTMLQFPEATAAPALDAASEASVEARSAILPEPETAVKGEAAEAPAPVESADDATGETDEVTLPASGSLSESAAAVDADADFHEPGAESVMDAAPAAATAEAERAADGDGSAPSEGAAARREADAAPVTLEVAAASTSTPTDGASVSSPPAEAEATTTQPDVVAGALAPLSETSGTEGDFSSSAREERPEEAATAVESQVECKQEEADDQE